MKSVDDSFRHQAIHARRGHGFAELSSRPEIRSAPAHHVGDGGLQHLALH
jgi:hypothetical protein